MSRTRDISNLYTSDDFDKSNTRTITSDYTALVDDTILVNTASSALTVTLPASPIPGSKLRVIDAANNASTNRVTILGNGNNISGASAYFIDIDKSYAEFTYLNLTQGWLVNNLFYPLAKPGTPTSVSATDVGTARAYNDGAATVSFVAPTSGGLVDSYTVTSTPGNFTGSGVSSPIVVAGLQSNTSYTFTVSATNVAGTTNSSSSNSITATTVPQEPTISTVQYGYEQLAVNYTAGATGGKAVSAYTATRTGAVTASGNSPIAFTGLTGGTAYTISMIATNANGNSIASNSVVQTPFTASGGTTSTSGSYRVHTFTSSSSFVLTGNTVSCDYLIIAGGGAGGSWYAGGGGAGGYLTGSLSVTPNTYTAVVGNGGSGGWQGTFRVAGGNSSIFSLSAIGGGGGGQQGNGGGYGGSGGGGGDNSGGGSGEAGPPRQGNNGGTSTGFAGGGGGGGASAAGSGVTGGSGTSSSINGTATVRAGGGGGGNYYASAGSGGAGGGGSGGYRQSSAPQNGSANTGGGGGGASEQTSGSGGSGIIIVRYLTTVI
jgi:hypothetical protein